MYSTFLVTPVPTTIDKCHTSLVREIRTDELISNYCKKHGMIYNEGAIVNSYDHLQLVLVHDKLAPFYNRSRCGSQSRLSLRCQKL
jgi:hypothetical protein